MAETIDFVVIGGGIAGLSAAALLAREGRRVAVFEKHGKLGGYAQYFGQDPCFDSATHLIGGAGDGGWLRGLLEETGAAERVELVPLDPVYQAIFPRHHYCAAADAERFRQELCTLWPGEAAAIGRFFEDLDTLGRAYLGLLNAQVIQMPTARHHDRTLSDFLNDYTRDEELRAALSALWIFGGLPPQRLSVMQYALLWHTFHTQGSATVRGGVRALTTALADVVTAHGGTVETRVEVTKIVRDRGRIHGARLSDGREFRTRAILSTASPHDTFDELLSAEGQTAAGYPALRTFATSVSSVQVHLLVNGPLEPAARTTILHSTYDQHEAFFDMQADMPEYHALVCTVLDHGEPGRAPEGKHLLSLWTLAPYSREDNWYVPFHQRRGTEYRTMKDYLDLREEMGDEIVRRAEDLFPGLAERVETRKVATPITMERYTFNAGGAAFGWANVPEQCGAHRPGPQTSFSGLYMAGHWTFPGGGIAQAAMSGRIAARAMLQNA